MEHEGVLHGTSVYLCSETRLPCRAVIEIRMATCHCGFLRSISLVLGLLTKIKRGALLLAVFVGAQFVSWEVIF